jgi:hypothetical protein
MAAYIYMQAAVKQKTEAHVIFLKSVYHLLIVQKEVCLCPFVDEESNGR